MKILKSNLKKGEITVIVQSLDDLWYLSQVIEPGDLIKGKTTRKVQLRGKEERSSESVKKQVWITLAVENIEFHKYSSILRASGMIIEAPEEIPKAHHTFNFEEGVAATIIKEKWYNYQLGRLKEATTDKKTNTIICVFDREEAEIAILKEQGYEMLAELKGQVQKKEQKTETKNFYKEIIEALQGYSERHKADHIIIASPSFWKEELLKEMGSNKMKEKLIMATCSSVKGGINEVLKRPELKEVLKQERTAKESTEVEELFAEISKQGMAAYGLEEVRMCAEAGAVSSLLITDGLIQKTRQENTFKKIEWIMKDADKKGAEIMIINSENEPGKKLDALGGIGAMLRYKLSW